MASTKAQTAEQSSTSQEGFVLRIRHPDLGKVAYVLLMASSLAHLFGLQEVGTIGMALSGVCGVAK